MENEFFSEITEAVPAMIMVYDINTGEYIYANKPTKKILGYSPKEIIKGGFPFVSSLIHPDDAGISEKNNKALKNNKEKNVNFEYRIRHKNGKYRWFHTKTSVLKRDKKGKVEKVLIISIDITPRKGMEQEILKLSKSLESKVEERTSEIQFAKDKLKFLEEAGNILISSLDYKKVLEDVVDLIVPYLSDYCRIAIIDENKEIKEIAAKHLDPKKLKLVSKFYEEYKDRTGSTHGIERIIKSGKTEIIEEVSPKIYGSIKGDPELIKIINLLELKSYMGIPLKARGRTIGAITLSSVTEGRNYSKKDLRFAQELGNRIALAIDNAFLFKKEQQAVAIRDDFISIASHELRTPVTSLKMFTQILERQFQKNGQENNALQVKKFGDQIDRLSNLIIDLLDVSRMRHGRLEFNDEEFDLNGIVSEVASTLQATSRRHKISVNGRIRKMVWGDKERISQVISNLLTNAIKYSPNSDKIMITLSRASDVAIVKVRDYGIGIEKEHQTKIFERFYRVAGPKEKTFPGMGIGLYISYEIVKRHGGKMDVLSEKGKGSEFSFTIPYKKTKQSLMPIFLGGNLTN